MLKRHEGVSYELLRPGQVKALRSRAPIAYIPAGSLEWHGFHNPLGCDSLKAHAVCCEAALKHGGVVLPPFFQGLLGMGNWGPKEWDGFTLGYNEPKMFEAAMTGICRALVTAGWKVIVGVTGHDVPPQRAAIQRAITTATKGKRATGFAMMEGDLHRRHAGIPFHMDHAAAWETSCMMYLFGRKVDLGTLRKRKLQRREDFEMSGPEGMGGKNPLRYASPQLGRRITERMGDLIGAKAQKTLRSVNRR